ncbi:MAG TPA: hypothetical protein VKR53_00160 [Puia sp.]|nr:hypothetical protein [Puia sp.]
MKNPILVASILFFCFLITIKLSAQVPVRNEPHHQVVLENDYVRLIDVHIKPHDTTLTHIHAAPSVIVFLSKSTIGTQIVGAAPSIANVIPAQTSYAAYDEKPITHKVWNDGDSVFHVMDIELAKKEPAGDTCGIILQTDFHLEIVKKLVHVYILDLNAEKMAGIQQSNCAHLLIGISGIISANNHSLTAGKFYFFPPHSNIEIISGKENARCVLLELK